MSKSSACSEASRRYGADEGPSRVASGVISASALRARSSARGRLPRSILARDSVDIISTRRSQDRVARLHGGERIEDAFDAAEHGGELLARHAVEIAHAVGDVADQRIGRRPAPVRDCARRGAALRPRTRRRPPRRR